MLLNSLNSEFQSNAIVTYLIFLSVLVILSDIYILFYFYFNQQNSFLTVLVNNNKLITLIIYILIR